MTSTASKAPGFLAIILASAAVSGTALADVLVDYQADTLPPAPWVFISNGPPAETSQHTVFVEDGVLHMIDTALLVGNTLGYLQHLPLEPDRIIEVEFRARVLSGMTALGDGRAPFSVWLYNGTVRADLSVGPDSVTALGADGLLLDEPLDGTSWHDYRYRLTPEGIEWWVDDVSLGGAAYDLLIPNNTDTDRRINMFITSAAANVELDSLRLRQFQEDRPVPAVSGWGLVALASGMSVLFAWRLRRSRPRT